jgi:hypothetical protein
MPIRMLINNITPTPHVTLYGTSNRKIFVIGDMDEVGIPVSYSGDPEYETG